MTVIQKAGIQGEGRKRVIIEGISPAVDGGRFPVKRTVGDQVRVEADIFTDGHDAIAASLLAHREGHDSWQSLLPRRRDVSRQPD